ncbi:MAG: hypothetical protein HUN04_25790 [Desulfobacter sp.]|nr:MAG: hypothetical protein HUN04_25790 [Desulfobacter sp.]
MKKIIIGGLAALIGVAGISQFFFSFLGVMAGALPALLILGGALAFYLGFTDVQEAKKDIMPEPDPDIPMTSDATAPSGTAPEKDAPGAAPPAAPQFKGNAETLVFHSIDCKFAQGKKCTAEFATREAALDQGYKPCKVCNP